MARFGSSGSSSDWNTWAQGLNKKNLASGQTGVRYQLNEPTAGGGTKSVTDPIFSMSNPDYRSQFLKNVHSKPTEAGATLYSTAEPNSVFYSPTGSDWQQLNEQSLSDPTAWNAVQKGAATPGLGQGAFSALLAKAPEAAKQAATSREGSTFSLNSDVLSKMWR